MRELPETSHVKDLRAALAERGHELMFVRDWRPERNTMTFRAGGAEVDFNERGYVTRWSMSGAVGSVGGRWGYRSGREALNDLLRYIREDRHPAYHNRPFFPETTRSLS